MRIQDFFPEGGTNPINKHVREGGTNPINKRVVARVCLSDLSLPQERNLVFQNKSGLIYILHFRSLVIFKILMRVFIYPKNYCIFTPFGTPDIPKLLTRMNMHPINLQLEERRHFDFAILLA